MATITLGLLGLEFRIECDPEIEALVRGNFGLLCVDARDEPVRVYRASRNGDRLFTFETAAEVFHEPDDGALLYHLEKALTMDLQRLRPDLLFMHAAVVAWQGQGALIVAASGTGKSTTTLALAAHGFDYLSDELAPVALDEGWVWPYPHALCLKQIPPGLGEFPPGGFKTSRTWHLCADRLTGGKRPEPVPVSKLFFLERESGLAAVHPISAAEAGARLYAQALNLLAHPAMGIDAVLRLASMATAYRVEMGSVGETATLIARVIRSVPEGLVH